MLFIRTKSLINKTRMGNRYEADLLEKYAPPKSASAPIGENVDHSEDSIVAVRIRQIPMARERPTNTMKRMLSWVFIYDYLKVALLGPIPTV